MLILSSTEIDAAIVATEIDKALRLNLFVQCQPPFIARNQPCGRQTTIAIAVKFVYVLLMVSEAI